MGRVGSFTLRVLATSAELSHYVDVSITITSSPVQGIGDLEIVRVDSAIVDPEMGQLVPFQVVLQNKGQGIVRAGAQYDITFSLVDYKGSEGSVWRAIDSPIALWYGSWTMQRVKTEFTLQNDLDPGEATWLDFSVKLATDIESEPLIMTDTMEVAIASRDGSDTGSFRMPYRVWPSWDDTISTLITLIGVYLAQAFGCKTVGEMATASPSHVESVFHSLLKVVKDIVNQDWAKTAQDLAELTLQINGFFKLDPFSVVFNFAKSLVVAGKTVAYAAIILADYIVAALQEFGVWIVALSLGSPVDILITTEDGRKIGYVDGQKYEEVQYSTIEVVGDEKYIVFPMEEVTLQLFGTGSGTFTLSIVTTDQQRKPVIVSYENQEVNPFTTAEGQFGTDPAGSVLKKDNNGDGSYDEEIRPEVSEVKSPATVIACDGTGWPKKSFDFGEDVYVKASNLLPSLTVEIYLVPDGGELNPSGAVSSVTVQTDSQGTISLVRVWTVQQTTGDYDIWLDVNRNGLYDSGDVLSDPAAGTYPITIPEMSALGAVVFLLLCLALAHLLIRRASPRREPIQQRHPRPPRLI